MLIVLYKSFTKKGKKLLGESFENNNSYIVGLYLRLSKDDDDKDESESITNQRKILRAFAKENNYKIYDEYVDDGYSGTNFNRPSFKRMINDIKSKKINMVITKNLARLGRDYIETGRYIESFFPENNVRYIAILDDVDTYLDKNCDTVAFKNIMNDFYAKETSKNIKKTKNRKKQEGFYYITYAPFGYKKVNKSGDLVIDEVAADVVRRIYNEFLNGKGTYQIAQLLNKEKVETPGIYMKMPGTINNKTKTTDLWKHTTIKRILTNPIYIGTIVQNKRKKLSYKSKKMVTLPENQRTQISNHHEAIIEESIFNKVQTIFKNSEGTKIKEEDALLKSLLYCYHCHNKMIIRKSKYTYNGKTKTRRYIYCNTAISKYSNKICYKKYINYDKLEEKVLKKISDIFEICLNSDEFDKKSLLDNYIKSQSNRGRIEDKLNQIKEQLQILNKKISTLYNDKLNGLIEEQDYIEFSENMLNERHKLEKLMNDTKNEFEEFDNHYNCTKTEENLTDLIKIILQKGKPTKEDLQELVNKIEIDKDKNIFIHFNFYKLNCIGGIFNYNDKSNSQAINS